eukprot:404010-Pleurochrysis_carterae.AAC.1
MRTSRRPAVSGTGSASATPVKSSIYIPAGIVAPPALPRPPIPLASRAAAFALPTRAQPPVAGAPRRSVPARPA